MNKNKQPNRNLNKTIERSFTTFIFFILGFYALFVILTIGSTTFFTDFKTFYSCLISPATIHSIVLSLWTSTLATVLAILIAIPVGYALARYNFPGKSFLDLIMSLPITLPVLAAGLALLTFFTTPLGKWMESIGLKFVFTIPGIVLAQFFMSASFAIVTIKAAFEEINPNFEIVARTLGCNRIQAFMKTSLPLARYGIGAGIILTWARAIGEFIPILLFVGAIEGRTDILPIRIFLKIEMGALNEATALLLILISICLILLPLSRLLYRKNAKLV